MFRINFVLKLICISVSKQLPIFAGSKLTVPVTLSRVKRAVGLDDISRCSKLVGRIVGCPVGCLVGCPVGLLIVDGLHVGWPVGSLLGKPVGAVFGVG